MSDAHHNDGPPGLPEVTDEAAPTPNWVPMAGFALLALIAIVTVARMQVDAPATDDATGQTNVADDAPPSEP